MDAHVQIRGMLRASIFCGNNPKGISAAALCEIIFCGKSVRNYDSKMGNLIWDLIQSHVHLIFGITDEAMGTLLNVLTNGRVGGRVTDRLRYILYRLDGNFYHKDLDDFEIVVSGIPRVWKDHLAKFRHHSQYPLYVDTENCYGFRRLPHGRAEALVTICDVDTRTILLARTHEASTETMDWLMWLISRVSFVRDFAVFGRETILDNMRGNVWNLQDGNVSLKNALFPFDVTIVKHETVSDWTRGVLREDQQKYAAMDALGLHHLFCRERIRFK